MHILYVDNSGTVDDPTERFFVLGAISVFERGLFHQIKAVDECVASFGLGDPHDIELHASAMYSGRDGVWRTVRHRPARRSRFTRHWQPFTDTPAFAYSPSSSTKRPLALAILSRWHLRICNHFNLYITRTNDRRGNENQRGLIVMDESKHEKPLQTLARKFRIDRGAMGSF